MKVLVFLVVLVIAGSTHAQVDDVALQLANNALDSLKCQLPDEIVLPDVSTGVSGARAWYCLWVFCRYYATVELRNGRIRGFKNSAVTAAALDLSSTVPELSFRTETSNLEFDVGSLKLSPRFFLAITISGAVSVSSIAVDWIISVDFNALNGIEVAAVSAQLTGIDVSINFGNVFYKTVLGFTETLIENNLESAINNALPGVSSSLSSAMNEAVSGLLMQTCTA